MSAYLFWHRPFPEVPRDDYEAALTAFHRDLGARRGHGFEGSSTYRTSELPWLDGLPGYEDWNFVESLAALDRLNTIAVAPDMWDVHAAVSSQTDVGHGGIYYHILGDPDPRALVRTAWLTRPRGIRYEAPLAAIVDQIAGPVSAWRKQMVLGPGAEFAVIGGADLALDLPESWAAVYVDRVRLASGEGVG